MAMYMMFYVVSDDHLDYLQNSPEYIGDYLQGEKPEEKKVGLLKKIFSSSKPLELPADWPSCELACYSPEINHRMVEAFHYLLNGTTSPVSNSGAIFQTWFNPDYKSSAISIDTEIFALKSDETKQLLIILESLIPELVYERYRDKIDPNITQDDKQFLISAFDEIKKACNCASQNDKGILWLPA